MKQKILVVEDDPAIARLIALNLNMADYEAIEVHDGAKAQQVLEEKVFDLVILDVMLPHVDGFSLLSKIKNSVTPVIFLTARDSVADKVKGLKMGADDYMVKPFEGIELLARVEAVLRRYGKNSNILVFKDIQLSVEERIVKKGGKPVELTPREYDLLYMLLNNKNIALSREQLLEKVWGVDYYGETRTVDMHIQKIRKKLNLADNIKTVHKVGYRLED